VTGYGDAFGWPFKDPAWFGKLLVTGLIAVLIPIVGQIYLVGWMLAGLDNLRRGQMLLPETTFDHFSRGLRLIVVQVVWGLVVAIPAILLYVSFFAAMMAYVAASQAARASGTEVPPPPAFGGFVLFPVITLLSLGIQILFPAIVVNTERGGIGGGLNVGQVWRTFTSRPSTSIIAGLMVVVAGYLSGIGILLCCVGIFVTLPYAYAVQAGVVALYERDLSTAPPSPA
jgi:hypothetical protein